MNDDAADREMLDKLRLLAEGIDPTTFEPLRISLGSGAAQVRMMEAQRQYAEFKDKVDQRRIARERMKTDVLLEEKKQQTQLELEHRRLDIEQEKVQIQKAEVLVRALEVAAQSGVNPDQLLGAIRELGSNLLAGPTPSLLLEQKK